MQSLPEHPRLPLSMEVYCLPSLSFLFSFKILAEAWACFPKCWGLLGLFLKASLPFLPCSCSSTTNFTKAAAFYRTPLANCRDLWLMKLSTSSLPSLFLNSIVNEIKSPRGISPPQQQPPLRLPPLPLLVLVPPQGKTKPFYLVFELSSDLNPDSL